MKRNTHVIGALSFGFLSYILYLTLEIMRFPTSSKFIISIFLNMKVITFFTIIIFSFLGGILPDMLDPPFSSRHRKYAHSKVLFLIFFALWVLTLFSLVNNWRITVGIIFFFLSGYISHLLLDSLTPAGLY